MGLVRRLLAGAAAALLVLVVGTAPAPAHPATGEFTATRAEPNSAGGYTIDVLLTYTNDGHGAVGATVTVTAQGPTGGPIPVPMAAGDREGAYTGDVELTEPGTYTISASSPDPEAVTTFTVDVAAPTTTTTEAPTTTAPAPASSVASVVASDTDDSNSEEGAPWWSALIFAGIGAAIGVAYVRWRNARRSDPAP